MNNAQALPRTDSHNPEPDLIPTDRVIEGVEIHDDWLAHREIFVQELFPVGALETLYAERAALYLWRLDRVIGFENAAQIDEIEARSEKSLEDSPESRVNRDSPDRSKLQTIIKYEAHLVRCLASTMAELRRLQKERRQGLRPVDEIDETSARSAPLEHGETASERVISREGEPPCEPVFTDTNRQTEARSAARGAFKDIPASKDLNGRANLPVSRLIDVDQESDDSRLVMACITLDSYNKGNPLHQDVRRPVSGLSEQNSNISGSGSPGGSPSQTGSPTQTDSPSLKNNSLEMLIPGEGGAAQAGVCQNQQIKDGSPGGSPSQNGSPYQNCSPVKFGSLSQKSSSISRIIGAEISISVGGVAAQAGVCQNQQLKDGSPGGSPSQNGSPYQSDSPSQKSSPSRKRSAQGTQSAPKRASPIPKPPPLLASITNRRRLEEYTRGEIFERNLASATLNFAMIPCP